MLTCVTDNENTGDVISELQSTLTDGKALYHKKDYSVAIQKIEDVLSSSSNKKLISEVYSDKSESNIDHYFLYRPTYCWQNATRGSGTSRPASTAATQPSSTTASGRIPSSTAPLASRPSTPPSSRRRVTASRTSRETARRRTSSWTRARSRATSPSTRTRRPSGGC